MNEALPCDLPPTVIPSPQQLPGCSCGNQNQGLKISISRDQHHPVAAENLIARASPQSSSEDLVFPRQPNTSAFVQEKLSIQPTTFSNFVELSSLPTVSPQRNLPPAKTTFFPSEILNISKLRTSKNSAELSISATSATIPVQSELSPIKTIFFRPETLNVSGLRIRKNSAEPSTSSAVLLQSNLSPAKITIFQPTTLNVSNLNASNSIEPSSSRQSLPSVKAHLYPVPTSSQSAKYALKTPTIAPAAIGTAPTDYGTTVTKNSKKSAIISAVNTTTSSVNSSINKKSRKSKPSRSIPSQVKQPLSAHERESAGIVTLDVYTTYRTNPLALLITVEESRARVRAEALAEKTRRRDRASRTRAAHTSAMAHGIVASNVVVGNRRSVSAALSAAAAATANTLPSAALASNTTVASKCLPRSSSASASDEDATALKRGNNGNGGVDTKNSRRRSSGGASGSNATLFDSTESLPSPKKPSKRKFSDSFVDVAKKSAVSDRVGSIGSLNSESLSESSSPKKSRRSSPTKNWSWEAVDDSANPILLASTSSIPRSRPAIPQVKYIPHTGESGNDKVRPLPFPLIDQAKVDEYTECKDTGELVSWKKSPISFSEDIDGYSKLAADELETCSILRVPPSDYLQVKVILLSARNHFETFTKRQAQKWYGIDVNKTGKIFDWFVSKNWLLLPSKGKAKK
ncbi:hypothetical protein HK100_012675 [Physocladia obscura]|uniref:SWIRM domain-containing protein n=1 Tax=Physocladia obscura TaxID=109957 RepID=A0AAD5T911_9FUNG|nr:hypothetical protein HK100_012675 [Physocladia obscura]